MGHRLRFSGGRLLIAMLAAFGVSVGLVTAPAQAAVGVPATYDGPGYASIVKRPSENKPQSKLWHTDGSWWALMVTGSSTSVRIHQLMSNHTWRDTGTVVDTRLNSSADALWSASDGKLFVASRASTTNLQVSRFSYQAATDKWSVDPGFPVSVSTGGGSESATIDRDSTGRLWVTYTQRSRLWVAHSDVTGTIWTAGFQPNVGDVAIRADDISSLIAFQDSIGILWSDQQSGAFRFAIHSDDDPTSQWRVENALSGATVADDHINLKQLTGDAQGRIFAAIKTGNDAQGSGATLVGVLVRTPGLNGVGSWKLVPAGTVADDHTRPILMIDQTNSELYFFATAPVQGGDIYYKKTSLASPSFEPGRGEKFVDSSKLVNNASGSKDPVTAATGMVVLAVAEGAKRYVHAEMNLAGGGGGGGGPVPPGDETAPTMPTGLQATGGPGGVDLTWSASTDDFGVAGYRIRRDGAVRDTTSGTSYSDTGVSPGSYSYTVEAFDAASNTSPATAPVSATVPPGSTGDGISLRDASTGSNSSASTLTVTRPATQAGDVLLASVDYRGKANISTPAGWQLLRVDSNGTAMRKATYWKVATAAEPASWTWTFSAKPAAVGTVLAYAGADPSVPVSAGQVNASSRNVVAPSVTAEAGATVVRLFGIARGATISPPAGMTERSEITSPSGVSYPVTAESADQLHLGGATGPGTAVSNVSGPSIGHTVALRHA